MTEGVWAGGVDDRDASCIESRREELSGLTVLMDGEGGVAVSDEIVGSAMDVRFMARYDK